MKKKMSWPKPPDCDLDDDIGLLIGNRIHRVAGGMVIGQQVAQRDVVNTLGAPAKAKGVTQRAVRRKSRAKAK
jgi:hypothetical protein